MLGKSGGSLIAGKVGYAVICAAAAVVLAVSGWAHNVVSLTQSLGGGISISNGASVGSMNILLMGLGIAILSSVIPFSLELEILRHLSARVFGVLMSLEPAIATLIGFIVLGETVGLRAIIAITLIVIASGGVSLFQQHNASDKRKQKQE